MRRRAVLLLAACLAGCGFHPLYEPTPQAEASLGSVFVTVIPNRWGQELRQALQVRLGSDSGQYPKEFLLDVGLGSQGQAVGIQSNTFATRTRTLATATWTLHAVNDPTKVLAKGMVRSLDGYDVFDNQFLASTYAEEAMERRQSDNLADQIAAALSAYFQRHPHIAG